MCPKYGQILSRGKKAIERQPQLVFSTFIAVATPILRDSEVTPGLMKESTVGRLTYLVGNWICWTYMLHLS